MTKAAELAKMGEVLTNSQIGGRRNIVINGAMQVAQRATSATGLGDGGGYSTLDRHRFSSGNTAGRLTQSQASVTDLPGFANAMKLDCTTADTSIAANENCSLQYRFEGQDLQQLKKGTSSAEKVTVSFYMKTNKAFTFMCELDDTDNNRVNTQQFTTSTSWTRHILTFVGDTTGTFDDDNARSMQLNFWIHAGSNFTGGTYSSNTWQSRATSDNMRAVGIGSFYDNTDNELHLTGVQLEVGSQATPFEHRSFGEELALCQRYYEVFAPCGNQNGNLQVSRNRSNTNSYQTSIHFMEKRALPTCTINYDRVHKPGVTYDSLSSMSCVSQSGGDHIANSAVISLTPGSDHTSTYHGFLGISSGTGKITIDAEI